MSTLRIISRNDTASNWIIKNPTLSKGEFGLENNTGLVKVGDGTTAWNSLSYANFGSPTDAEFTVLSDAHDALVAAVAALPTNAEFTALSDAHDVLAAAVAAIPAPPTEYYGRVAVGGGTGVVTVGNVSWGYSWSGFTCTVTHNLGTTDYVLVGNTIVGDSTPLTILSAGANSMVFRTVTTVSPFMFRVLMV